MAQAPVRTLPASHPRRGFRVSGWIAALVALTFALFGAVPASAMTATEASAPADDTTVSWSARPADTAQGSGRPNFSYEMIPGGNLTDGIIVTNRGTTEISLDVYAADGFLTADGSLDILAADQPSTELGSWVDVGMESVTLDAGESAEIPFDVTLPASIQPGDYTAGIVASMSVEGDNGVLTERRLGSRMHLRVLGDLVPGLEIGEVQVEYHGTPNPVGAGAATVTFTVTNTGNARLAPSGVVTLSGPFGLAPVALSLDEMNELLPGSSLEHVVEVDSVAPLFMTTAELVVDADVVQRPGDDTSAVPGVDTSTASAASAAIPWTALGILVLAVLLIVWGAIARRRSKAGQKKAVDDAVAAALAERDASLVTPSAGAEERTDARL